MSQEFPFGRFCLQMAISFSLLVSGSSTGFLLAIARRILIFKKIWLTLDSDLKFDLVTILGPTPILTLFPFLVLALAIVHVLALTDLQ